MFTYPFARYELLLPSPIQTSKAGTNFTALYSENLAPSSSFSSVSSVSSVSSFFLPSGALERSKMTPRFARWASLRPLLDLREARVVGLTSHLATFDRSFHGDSIDWPRLRRLAVANITHSGFITFALRSEEPYEFIVELFES